MQIRCYNFIKKHNSTVRPEASAIAVTFEVDLKRNTSINNPIFLLDIGDAAFNYNYIYWPEMGIYYFVDDVVYGNTYIKEIVCSCDVLATARQYIINQTAFVKYSTQNFDPYIKDDRVQPTSEISTIWKHTPMNAQIATPAYSSTSCYLLTTINDTGVTTYLLSKTELNYLGQEIIDHAEDIIGNNKKYFQDAHQSLIKLQVTPWSVDVLQTAHVISGSPSTVKLGGYSTGQSGYVVDFNSVLVEEDFVEVPSLPNNFTRTEPYCEGKIHIPLLGTQDISLAEIQDVSKVYYRYVSNILSGDTTCILYKGNSDINKAYVIATFTGNTNFEVPLGYISSKNATGAITGAAGVITAAAAVATGGSAAVVAGGISAAVASFASYMQKTTSMIGAFGGNGAAFDSYEFALIVYKHGLTEDPENLRQLYGRPCGKVLNLSSLVNGYVQTSEFELQGPFDAEMTSQVNRLMDNGVYLY